MVNNTYFDHARNPRNVGLLDDANVVIQAGDPECDDRLVYSIKIENDVIEDIRFLIEGCETTVATSSILTELVKGQSLDDIMNISGDTIADALSGFPLEKMHCPDMAASAMHIAVRQYRDTERGEASSMLHTFENYRIMAQILNKPLCESYSSEYDL